MKIHPLALFLTLAGPLHAQTPKPTAASYYQLGQAAEKAGDPAAAKAHYLNALKLNPNNADALFSMGQLKLTGKSLAAQGQEAKFGAVMVPAFQLDAAPLRDALDALSSMIEKESKQQVTPNFVIVDPKDLLKSKTITLNVKAISSKAALRYVLDQSGAKARFDQHAVVISPL